MKHVLIVAFHFPPESSSSGVLRTTKFARYLGEYGWRVTVLTIDPSAHAITDPTLLAQVPSDVRVIRTKFVELRAIFSVAGKYPAILTVPDPWLGWYPYATHAGLNLARHERVDAVFSTSPHPTAHLIAQRIALASGVPSVIDFRDPWYESPPEPGTPKIVHWCARLKERGVVRAAAHVVASTAALHGMLRSRYPELASSKFSCIPNGFDASDFPNVAPKAMVTASRLVILHAGSINAQFRDPRPLFTALRRLIAAGAIDADGLKVRFLGPGEFSESPAIAACISDNQLGGCVEFLPRVDYREALRQMSDADLLLLLQASDDTASLVPAKLYEYLRAGRPVLAMVQPGATTEVLQTTGGGWCCDPADRSELDRTLYTIAAKARSGELSKFVADEQRLCQYDRRVLTGQLADVLSAVTSAATAGPP